MSLRYGLNSQLTYIASRTKYKKSLLGTRFQCLSTRSTVPRVAETSIWTAMIPKFLRPGWRASEPGSSEKKRNPATYFVVMFILVGSQALRMVQIKNDHGNYVRSTEAKIRLLREVIERLQRGEDVDVRKLLGTGDEIAEREWEEAIREISQEEPISQPNTKPLPKPGTEPTTQNDKGADTTHPPKQARDSNQDELKKRTAKFY